MKKLLIIITLISLVVSSTLMAVADEFGDVEKQIEELKQKIAEAQNKEKTLTAEINNMDEKIRLKELEVAETETKIQSLANEINQLNYKISRLESTLSRMSEILLNRIITTYKVNRISYLTLLLSADGLTDLVNRIKYIERAQIHDREVMTEVQITKVNFSEQKELRERKRQEQEELKILLESQKAALDKQKRDKQSLLEQTRNDEAEYQRLLQQALAEKQALEAALITGERVGTVKKGDPIALVGNTGYPGCSTGKHLHLEIRQNNQWTNPADFLKSHDLEDQQNGGRTALGSGNWEWPIEGEIVLTQHYGQTPYSWRYQYSGGVHTGLDMFSSTSDVIRAPADGELYSASQNCGDNSTIKIKYIDHGNDLISFYLHVQ